MEIIALFVAVIMIPHIIGSAIKVGELFFKGISFVLGGFIFFIGLMALLGAILS